MNQITFGEFFCGAGGLSLGAISAQKTASGHQRMKSAWAVDHDGDACATYHRNIHRGRGRLASESSGRGVPGIDVPQGSDPLVLSADIRNLDFSMLNPIDAFLFGFPCNDFSSIGETRGLDGSFGPLYEHGIRLIIAKNPRFFVAENVTGIVHANDRRAFRKIIDDLHIRSLGEERSYVVTPHLYRFEEYGIPQNRHRVMIVGIRSDVARSMKRPFMPPAPTGIRMTAGEALAGLSPELPNSQFKPLSDIVLERLRYIAPGQNIWDVNDTIPCHLRLKAKGTKISSIYKVIHPDRPAYTVTASGGGGTQMYHWEKRATTDRERARLQTFPDDFVFEGKRTAVRRQIGMAVPPEAARIVIDAVLKTLDGREYDFVEPNLRNVLDPDHTSVRKPAVRKAGAATGRNPRRASTNP